MQRPQVPPLQPKTATQLQSQAHSDLPVKIKNQALLFISWYYQSVLGLHHQRQRGFWPKLTSGQFCLPPWSGWAMEKDCPIFEAGIVHWIILGYYVQLWFQPSFRFWRGQQPRRDDRGIFTFFCWTISKNWEEAIAWGWLGHLGRSSKVKMLFGLLRWLYWSAMLRQFGSFFFSWKHKSPDYIESCNVLTISQSYSYFGHE